MNRIRTFIAATLLTPLLIVGSARAAMITQTTSFGPADTDLVNQPLSPTLAQFNPANGTLTSVVITASSSIIATISGTFITGNSGGTYTATLGTNPFPPFDPSITNVTGQGISGVSNSATNEVFFAANTTQTISFGPSTILMAGPTVFTLSSSLSPFIGNGNLPNYLTNATAYAEDSFSGGGNFTDETTIETQGSATVTVVYNYTPAPVPEPSSLLLLSGLSLGLVSYRGCRKLRTYFLSRNSGTETSPG